MRTARIPRGRNQPVSPARILQIYEPPDGGSPSTSAQLGSSLWSEAVRSLSSAPPQSNAYPQLEAAGARIRRLDLTGAIFAPGSDLSAARALRRIRAVLVADEAKQCGAAHRPTDA